MFASFVDKLDWYGDLPQLMAFHREGTNHLDDGDYIQAFYSFYFIIEGLYGQGRSNENEIVKAFKASTTFMGACDDTVRHYVTPGTAGDTELPGLQPWLDRWHLVLSTDLLPKLLVRLRNHVHHFNWRSGSTQPHPFNQDVFSAVSRLVMHVSMLSLLYEQIPINRAKAGLEP